MQPLLKLHIYLTIIVIIAFINNADMTQTKSQNGMSDLLGMDEPPEKVPEFESFMTRKRRDVDALAADDIPKEEPNARFRVRREAPPGESDVPKEFQENGKINRAKRQMPPPPGEMPMPPV
ncbi:uncharacterized protein LOC111675709 isoform X2 [Lucilia cuprina]|uniref:uncharacterized protein LOC111675709 isoform X2 n=1 Tax=Lucilia cuprina TaxID=7375 RepID=UPI001F059AE6|nr:uncharacterized protein LOC111675709 isoform X2 [Lucilia cuprina]